MWAFEGSYHETTSGKGSSSHINRNYKIYLRESLACQRSAGILLIYLQGFGLECKCQKEHNRKRSEKGKGNMFCHLNSFLQLVSNHLFFKVRQGGFWSKISTIFNSWIAAGRWRGSGSTEPSSAALSELRGLLCYAKRERAKTLSTATPQASFRV